MSLLTVCRSVAGGSGLPQPASVVGSTNPLSIQMLELANDTLAELGRMDWPVLHIEHQFNTVDGTSQYALPAGFKRAIADTAYLASQYYSLRGSMTAADWQRQRNALPSQIGRYNFRIFGNPSKINIAPTPTTVESVVMEYVTSQLTNSGATYAADTDVSVLDEELVRKGLKWRVKRERGLDYSEDFNDYELTRQTVLAQTLALGSMPVAYRNLLSEEDIPYGYIPEAGFGV